MFEVGRLVLLLSLLRTQYSQFLAASFYFLVEFKRWYSKTIPEISTFMYMLKKPTLLYNICLILDLLASFSWSLEQCPEYLQVVRGTFLLQFCIAFRIILSSVPQRLLYDVLIQSWHCSHEGLMRSCVMQYKEELWLWHCGISRTGASAVLWQPNAGCREKNCGKAIT